MAKPKVRGVPVRDRLVSLKAGTLEVFPAKSAVMVTGKRYDKAALLQKIGELLTPFEEAELARKRLALAVRAREAVTSEAITFADDATSAFENLHGPDAETLLKFGISSPKARRQLSAPEKAAAAAKAKATRDARKAREQAAVSTPVVVAPPKQTNTIVVAEEPAPKEANGTSH